MGHLENVFEICDHHDIKMDEVIPSFRSTGSLFYHQDLAERLSQGIEQSSKPQIHSTFYFGIASDVHERKKKRMVLGKWCKQRGLYLISAKRFSEAGERMKAIKSLFRSGQVDKILTFASSGFVILSKDRTSF